MTGQLHILQMNVFFAPNSYGGATLVSEAVSHNLIKNYNARVSAISAMARPEFPPYAVMKCESDGVENYMINMPAGRSYTEMYRNPRVSERIGKLVRMLSPDIAHVHCLQEIGADAIGTLKQLGVPIILSMHDFWWLCERQFMIRPDGSYCGQDPVRIEGCKGCSENFDRSRSRFNYLHKQAKLADIITFPSRFAYDLSRRSGIGEENGVVWENGVQLPKRGFFELQAARRAADSRLSFGFVGGTSGIKGWSIIREAFQRTKRNGFVGHLVEGSLDGSWYRNQKISKMKGDWHIHPRYNTKTVDDFYAKIDVLLFMSQWKETFGLTVREALCRGIRVIQTDCGGAAEHAGPHKARMLQIGDSPQRLQQEIEHVLDMPGTHPDPIPVTSYTDQTKAFMKMAQPLINKSGC